MAQGPFHPVLLFLALVSVTNIVIFYGEHRYLSQLSRRRLDASGDHYPLGHHFRNQVALEYALNLIPIDSASLWSQLIPANGGVTATRDGKFIIAMYQQLRCLDEVRVAYLAVHGRPVQGRIPNATATAICLGQLWQIIQCNADITLDPAVLLERDGTLLPASSGEGVLHRCNDWTKVRDMVERA